jgi:branched-chain amino acid aminotransferase
MNIRLWLLKLGKESQELIEQEYPEEGDSFDSITMAIPGGAYTTFRTYEHEKSLRLDAHLERLKETSQLAGQPLGYDPSDIRPYIRDILDQYPEEQDLRIRIVIDLNQKPGDIYLMSEILRIPSEDEYRNGVKLVTCEHKRRNPKAKLTRSIQGAQEIRDGFGEDVHEALMLDEEGYILEGLTSNFFAIFKGELWTNEEDVLAGVTRSLVIEVADNAGLQINFQSLKLGMAGEIEEAFITSSSRAILPVVQINNSIISHGVPGFNTRMLMYLFRNKIKAEIEGI